MEHTVLNAKQNEREAEIVAQAGKRGSITIATNMAGRGTDIKLEPGVAGLGGLYVVGTTRHQSRRIDRQLRGRCARQGDPGTSKFYISFEDSLLRLFASPRITTILQKFRPPEGEPISAGMLNKSIETAQKRVEQRNYTMRKHTLEYDDVMNKQSQEIYSFRNDILNLEDIEPLAIEVIESVCGLGAERFFQTHSDESGWDPEGYRQWLLHLFPVTFEPEEMDQDHLDTEQIERFASERVVQAFKDKLIRENLKVSAHFIAQGEPPKPAHNAVRNLMIRKTDQMWQEHLLRMDHLRSDVTLRAVGQRDPLTEFKHEAFTLFDELSRNLRTEIARSLFRFEIITPQQTLQQLLQAGLRLETNRSLFADLQKVQPGVPFQTEGDEQEEEEQQEEEHEEKQKDRQDRQEPENDDHDEPFSTGPRIGRNELCPCGSGKKYKKCCQTEAV